MGYSHGQIESSPLSTIFPEEFDTNPSHDSQKSTLIIDSDGQEVPIMLSIKNLDSSNKIVALFLEESRPVFDLRSNLIAQEIFYENLALLPEINRHSELQSALNYVIDIIKKVVKSDFVSIYLENKNSNGLKCGLYQPVESKNFLPDILQSSDLTNLEKPLLWKGNKRQTSKLQELTHQAGYQYLVTIPLVKGDEWIGLIAIAGNHPIPTDESLRFLSLLGLEVAISIENILIIENAKKKIRNLRQVISIEQVIIDNLEEGTIIITPDLQIADMNPAAEIILGYSGREVFRQPVDSVIIGSESLSAAYNSALQGITTLVSRDLRLHNRTGKSFPAQVITIPVKTEDKVSSIIVLLRDLSQTEQIRLKSQQLEQRAFLGEVSAVFAHEVKNPINSLMTGLQFIGMNLEENSPHTHLVNRLQNDCLRLTHLMDSVLTFSKPVEYHLAPVDLGFLIPRILERWYPRMHRLNIKTYFETSDDHPLVLGDARALEQVFVNLISNAVQAMDPKGGSLNIRILDSPHQTNQNEYEIIFADTGPGIPKELIDHIFEPFISSNPNGTGLGLAISKRIITAHKGNITVESFPGGTMFHIFLPKSMGA